MDSTLASDERIAEYYTDDLAATIVDRFAADFDRFGYPTELPI